MKYNNRILASYLIKNTAKAIVMVDITATIIAYLTKKSIMVISKLRDKSNYDFKTSKWEIIYLKKIESVSQKSL